MPGVRTPIAGYARKSRGLVRRFRTQLLDTRDRSSQRTFGVAAVPCTTKEKKMRRIASVAVGVLCFLTASPTRGDFIAIDVVNKKLITITPTGQVTGHVNLDLTPVPSYTPFDPDLAFH